jgi:hypothetical protein
MNRKMTITTTIQLDTQASQRQELPRAALLGLAGGIFFLTFFGAFWGFMSTANMNSAFQAAAFLLVGLVTLGFFGIGVMLLRYANTLPKSVSPVDAAIGKRIAVWFGIIFGIEILLIALANILLSTFQLDLFITPVTALIVGIHFFPLARLFRVPVYYLTGVLLSALALVALVALLLNLPIASPSLYNWSLFVGFGTTLVLWLTVFSIARFTFKVMQHRV